MEKKIKVIFDNKFRYGMHACGSINDLMFTNSLEAMEYWYSQGINIFEIDIDDAGNGQFVACHNFSRDTFRKMEIEDIPEYCTYEWFKKQKLYHKKTKGLTPLTLKSIFELLHKYPDRIVMIDPKVYSYSKTLLLLDKIKCYMNRFDIERERIIFETYNEDMIRATMEYRGIMQYQYCIDDEIQMGSSEKMRGWKLDKKIEFLKNNNIYILSYPWKFAVEKLEILKRLKEEEFIIFSKTRNDIFSELLKKAGINVNLIDYLTTDIQKKNLMNYKTEYYEKYESKINRIFKNVF